MGTNQSKEPYEKTKEYPSKTATATLYYLPGRGIADPIRWVLAAADISFEQRVVGTREKFLKMSERQLPFGQLPLLMIDDLEIVQSNAILRYVAKRANMAGDSPQEEVKCDMISEAVRDLISVAAVAPFHRVKSADSAAAHIQLMKDKWGLLGVRLEAILLENGGTFMVGKKLTYADVVVVHAMTWFVEECGPQIVEDTPTLVNLQNTVITLPSIQAFIKSSKYYPLGDELYVSQISTILGRSL